MLTIPRYHFCTYSGWVASSPIKLLCNRHWSFLNQMRPGRIHIDVEPSRLLIAWSKEKYIVYENKTTTAISIKLLFHINLFIISFIYSFFDGISFTRPGKSFEHLLRK